MFKSFQLLLTCFISQAVFLTSVAQAQSANLQEVQQLHFQNIPSRTNDVIYFAKLLSQNEFLNKRLFSNEAINDPRTKIVHVNSRFKLNLPIQLIKNPQLWSFQTMMELVPTSRFHQQNGKIIATYQISGLAKLVLSSPEMSCEYYQQTAEQEIQLPASDAGAYINEAGLNVPPQFVVLQICKNFSQVFIESIQVLRFYQLPQNQTLLTSKTLMSVNQGFYSSVDLPFISPWKKVRDNYLDEVYRLKSALELKLK